MALKLDNQIKGCTPKAGVVSKAVAYCYTPVPAGVNIEHLSIEIDGAQVKRRPGADVFLYHAGDKPGQWELLSDVSEQYFIENFDFVE